MELVTTVLSYLTLPYSMALSVGIDEPNNCLNLCLMHLAMFIMQRAAFIVSTVYSVHDKFKPVDTIDERLLLLLLLLCDRGC